MDVSIITIVLLLFVISPILSSDGDVILKLANSITPLPPNWSTTSSTGYCGWKGINCDSSNHRVISISFSKSNLGGTLPTEISKLTNLKSLSLQDNQFSGPLPSLANLSNLQTLFLDNNNFTFVPLGFFRGLTDLQTLSIGNNVHFNPWELPLDLAGSTKLTTLLASKCNMFGFIPDIFGSMPSLQNLRLSYNNLTGTLPPSLGKSGVQNLWLNNQVFGLSGGFNVIAMMEQLSQVWLHVNHFTGEIPDLSNCKNIFDLQLRDNLLTGIVPESLISLPNLVNVSLSNNKFQGPFPLFPKSVAWVVNDGTNNFCAGPGVDCDSQVMSLIEVAGGFGFPVVLSDSWHGNDACDGWAFVSCDSKKNVVTVNLSELNLGGNISPAFENLTKLVNLYLSGNNLMGSIPEGLIKLQNLVVLNLSNNNLSGKVPAFPASVKLITKPGNTLLGKEISNGTGASTGSSPSTDDTAAASGSNSKAGSGSDVSGSVIAGIISAVVFFFFAMSFVLYRCKKCDRQFNRVEKQDYGNALVKDHLDRRMNCHNGYGCEFHSQSIGSDCEQNLFEGGNVAVSIEVLRHVTNNFSSDRVIGRGGFGVVYRGDLHDGRMVAVKRMESSDTGTKGLNEFHAELAVLTKVRHRHLVALLGYCVNGNERLLVYEYMSQGTLGQHLFKCDSHDYHSLTWKQRVTIALDVARGVEYLHSLAQQSFIHRDLKPSNILLGDDMRAKVADFGLVKNAPDGKDSMETRLAGTFGYLAPEYATTGRVTTKVDVYAFGVVLMEIITGRQALNNRMPTEKIELVKWFRQILLVKDNIPGAIDQMLHQDKENLGSIYQVAELAGHCTAREPVLRPDMGYVVNILAPLVEEWRPLNKEEAEGENFGIHMNMSLPQVLQRWQANEGTSNMFTETHPISGVNKPLGFPNSTSKDGR